MYNGLSFKTVQNNNTFNQPYHTAIVGKAIDVCLKLVIRDGENAERLL